MFNIFKLMKKMSVQEAKDYVANLVEERRKILGSLHALNSKGLLFRENMCPHIWEYKCDYYYDSYEQRDYSTYYYKCTICGASKDDDKRNRD